MKIVVVLAVLVATVAANEVTEAFEKNEVVPNVVEKSPETKLEVTYPAGEVSFGNTFTPTEVKSQPAIKWNADPDTFYTLLMTDPDAPSRQDPKFREWRHWLVVNIPGNTLTEGEVFTEYVGSGPPQGTGLHRYVFLLFKQSGKKTFDEPKISNTSSKTRPKFSTKTLIAKYGLELVAGNFFQAEWDDYVPELYQQLKD